jgi:hypothetical protein
MEGHLEMAKIEIAFGNFSPLRNFSLGRPPTRIMLQKKNKNKRNLFIFFHHLFSTIQGSVFLTLPPFERAFEPSLLLERAFELSFPSRKRLGALTSF